MNKYFFIIILILLTGCSQKNLTPEQIKIKGKKIINKICENSASFYYDNKNISVKIDECGEYFKIFPDFRDNYPIIINSQGKKIAECRPKIEGTLEETQPECYIKCTGKNLCLGVEVECSKENKDQCLLENSIRMKDKTICEKINNESIKNDCLK